MNKYIQRCRDCKCIFEENLVDCPSCQSKRIEILLQAGLKTKTIIEIKRHIKGLQKAIEKLEKVG